MNGVGGTLGYLADQGGARVQLHGVNRMGTEYMCLYGAFADGPATQANVDAMKSWNINAVRVPLNEDCWLGLNGVPAASGGQNYQRQLRDWVTLLTTNGLYVVLDLHWTAPGATLATGQLPMADADHAPTFWTQVATAYANDPKVIFDLFNEPNVADWSCWLTGGACAKDAAGQTFAVAGMADLLRAVRATGAENVVLMGGLGYAGDLSGWTEAVQKIPAQNGVPLTNVAASYHAYDFNSVASGCPSVYNGYASSLTCRSGEQTVNSSGVRLDLVLAAGFPVVMGESGISAFSASTARPFTAAQLSQLQQWQVSMLDYVYGRGQNVMAWSFNDSGTPALLADTTSYQPSPYFGSTVRTWLLGR